MRHECLLSILVVATMACPGTAWAQGNTGDPYRQAIESRSESDGQPAPVPIDTLGGAKLDTLQWLEPTIVAAAAFQKNKRGLKQGPVTIIDVARRQTLLEIPRPAGADRTRISRVGEVFLATIVDGRNKNGFRLTAFTLAPAQLLWSKHFAVSTRLLAMPLGNFVMTLEPGRKSDSVVARDTTTGRPLWEIEAPSGSYVETLADQLLVVEDAAIKLHAAEDGQPIWSVEAPLQAAAVLGVVTLGNRIGVYGPDELLLLDRATGSVLRRITPAEGQRFTAVYSHPQTMVATLSRQTSRRRLRNSVSGLLGLAPDGAVRWRHSVASGLDTALFLEARTVGFVSDGDVTVLDLDTGERIVDRTLPGRLRQRIDKGLFIRMTGSTVDVLSPYGRFRIDRDGLSESFVPLAHPGETIAGRAPVAYGSADYQRAMASAMTADLDLIALVASLEFDGDAPVDPRAAIDVLRGDIVGDGANAPGSGTDARQRELRRQLLENRARANDARRRPNAVSSEGRELAAAYDALSVASLETEIAATETRQTFARNAAMRDLAISAANALDVFIAELEAAADRAARLERGVAADQVSSTLSAGYLVSTPATAGCMIDVVRLADNAVARVQWRPRACMTQNCSPNAALPFPRVSISPGGDFLLFEGPGLDKQLFDPPRRVRELTFPNMRLFSLELAELAFRPADESIRRSTLFECRAG